MTGWLSILIIVAEAIVKIIIVESSKNGK